MRECLMSGNELSKLLNISYTTLHIHLARFSKYLIESKYPELYKCNYYFLTDLKKFYQKKILNHNTRHKKMYSKVIEKIDNLLEDE